MSNRLPRRRRGLVFLHLTKPPPQNHDNLTAEDNDYSSSTVLDLISCQLHDLNSVDLPPSLTANRLSSLDTHIATLFNLTKLSFRQNLFKDAAVEPISAWIALFGLKIPDASIFKKLLVFDFSFNEITSLQGMSKVSNSLKELYVLKNEVTKIMGE
uniref:protein phosphatase 1 regulatory subunit pprA-like n=1 Tax=Fragaria vesca subsp. vesca TaxID=101020 RepID=UPI0005CACFB2|nr:PREDICTED: protein phosphatase 1 regulatory subunit pprA-like [Fragaria vesca subsp. vesca]